MSLLKTRRLDTPYPHPLRLLARRLEVVLPGPASSATIAAMVVTLSRMAWFQHNDLPTSKTRHVTTTGWKVST